MNLDVDERLLPDGEYRYAENIDVIDSEGDDVGAIENPLSNRQLTNLNLGVNVKEIGKFEDEAEDKIYWFTKSEIGCFLLEWDDINQLASIVLKDTRAEDNGRVLNLKETHLITGIVKIISEDTKKDLLIWTDDNIEVCSINIERAKTWGENEFTKEDILLIKKPPRYALKATPAYSNDGSNNIEDKFLTFCYRYKYRDGEYSALSDYTNYKFTPKPFDLNFFTLENEGMVNSFNAVKLEFNSGEKQVTDIQLAVKNSNSNSIYIIETFNKALKGWDDNEDKSYTFSNSKLYSVLPEKELYRSFDNIPTKAKALTSIENIISLGNYEEGMDIVDADKNEINIDYSVSLISTPIDNAIDFEVTVLGNKASFTNLNNDELIIGKQLYFNLDISLANIPVYNNGFIFIIESDYSDLNALVSSVEFGNFVNVINNDYVENYNASGDYQVDPDYALSVDTSITFALESNIPTFTVTPVFYTDNNNNNALVTVTTSFNNTTYVGIQTTDNSISCKSNMGYEIGLEYQDEFNRRVPIVTSETNTLFIPIKYSHFKNQIRVTINNVAPKDADRYKICVKAKPLQYQTIYINEFYNEDNYVWAKLVAENKDKVKVGDELIVKKAGATAVTEVITVKVLDIQDKVKDFIEGNTDENENDIIESQGIYMKIRPKGFSMDLDDFSIHQSEFGDSGSSGFPVNYLDLFTEIDNTAVDPIIELKINQGSSIYLFINSSRNFDAGWRNKRFEKTFIAQRNYDTIEEWFNEVVLNGNSIPAPEIETDEIDDYKDNLELVRLNSKLHLKIKGLYDGGSNDRSAYCRAKIVVRNSTGVYVFETNPKQAEAEIYYQTEQCFDIINGNHLANNQNQDSDTFTPAIIDLDFFNCYTQGNGVESYKYKDGFNTNYLNIDLRPSSTSIERPRKIRRFADITYGQPFVESSGLNGLNEFNVSTANFKELDKQYGSIQRLFSRETDLLVWQEDKASKVLFGKDLLSMANGETVLSSTPNILGQQVPFHGENGIGLNPESLAWDMYRFYYTNSRRGTPIRLSQDGTSEINYGTIAHFRSLFIKNPTSYKFGGFDPYHKKYVLSSEDEDPKTYNSFCGNSIYKILTEPFTYTLNLNNLLGDIVLNYNVSQGSATIEAIHGISYVASNITGLGNLTIPRTDLSIDTVTITITPISDSIDIEITNTCPLGVPMNLFTIVLNSEIELNKTIINRYRYGSSGFYADNHLFEAFEISKFTKETGIEGIGKFPQRNNTVNIQSYKDQTSTGYFNEDEDNQLGYLATETEYTSADIQTILDNAAFVGITETQIGQDSFINQGSFIFNRPTDLTNLYLIWDYRRPSVVINQDTKIRMYFDNSGSMNSTLTPLTTMKDTILKNRLLPFYNNDSDLYDASVTIINQADERTIDMLNMNGNTPSGNVITLVFQDEASSIYHGATITPRTSTYETDIAVFRSRLNTFAGSYYRSVVFQVIGNAVFKTFVEAIQNGTGDYTGAYGLSDRTEMNYKYDIQDGGTPQYYLDQIVTALQELGYNI